MILDTNAISALQAEDDHLITLVSGEPVLFLNIISLAEYRYGIDGSTHRDELQKWLAELIERSEVLCLGLNTLECYSQLRHALRRAGTPIPANDLWIAALAREHNLPVLSRDAHFDLVPGIERTTW
jgi:tRNA(fMet)-specific endonuclease VapC